MTIFAEKAETETDIVTINTQIYSIFSHVSDDTVFYHVFNVDTGGLENFSQMILHNLCDL